MIAIKGMKMPKGCFECERGSICGYRLGYRPDDCPLVEIEERKVGKWIPHRAKYDNVVPIYECSICHKYNGFEDTNYCPHCGCFMSEGE